MAAQAGLQARDVMSTELISVTPATSLVEFARLCLREDLSGAPVLDEEGRLSGIVSKTDLLWGLLKDLASEEGEPSLRMPLRGQPHARVEDVMRTDVLVVAPATPAAEIAKRMVRDRIHRVLVIEEDRVVGLITSLDLLARLAGETDGPPV